MPRIVAACLALLGCVTLLPAGLPAADKPKEEPLVEQVRSAIDAGVRFLRKEERGQGSWERNIAASTRPGGCTALAILALLNAGVKPDDPLIQRGLANLRKLEPEMTYVVGLQTMVLAEVGDARDGPRIQANVDWLVKARGFRGDKLRGWGYSSPAGSTDFSNTQYALLGLHAGVQAGARIDRAVWESIRDCYVENQEADGGWIYSRDYPAHSRGPTLTMTVAGLCSLHIAAHELNAGRRRLRADGSDPQCGRYEETVPIARALDWLALGGGDGRTRLRFDLPDHTYYNVYGIERAGRLSGQRFLAGHDWYREGCEFLVRQQHEDGSWFVAGQIDSAPVIATSFALLFLSKGRTPILVSKFAHGPGEDWNNKHYDARHVVEYASKELFKRQPLAWQVYDARQVLLANRDAVRDEVGSLLMTPVVYLNGHEAPQLSAIQKQLLKQYVEEGGFVFAEACCGDRRFADGFRRLMKELFPDTPLQPLRPDHPIWTAHAAVPPDFVPLEGIESGCKTVVVFSPRALAGYWEVNQWQPREVRPVVPPDDRGTLAFRLAGNVIAYATGLEMPKPRLTKPPALDVRGEDRPPRGFLKVAQLQHEGDWQPAPRAMPTLMRYLRAEMKLDVALQVEEVRPSDPGLFLYKFLYLHGRRAFEFPPEALENLRADLKTGGLLFADACCGKAEFDRSFRAFAAKLFPDAKLEPIPVTDPLYGAEINGTPITGVRVRKERADGRGAEAEFRDAPPFLEGIRLNGRWVVIYSKYDVGCALEKHQSSDCKGHDHQSALRLAAAAVLYELKK